MDSTPSSKLRAMHDPVAAHSAMIWSVAISADGRVAASGSEDQTVKLWDVATGQPLQTLRGHGGTVHGVSLSANGRHAAVASTGGLFVWDLERGCISHCLKDHPNGCLSVDLTPDASLLISGSDNTKPTIWDLTTGKKRPKLTASGRGAMIFAVALTPDGRFAFSVDFNGNLRLWDLATSQEITCLHDGGNQIVWTVALSPDARLVASAVANKRIHLWDLAAGGQHHVLSGHAEPIRSIAFDANARCIVSASQDCTIRLWDPKSASPLALFTTRTCATSCDISSDASAIVAGDDAGQLYFLTTAG